MDDVDDVDDVDRTLGHCAALKRETPEEEADALLSE